MNAIEATNLHFRFGTRPVLRDVSLAIPQGVVYTLLGANGAGKTTLMQVLMGLRHPERGDVRIMGTPVRALGVRDRARIGYVAESQALPAWMTVGELEEYLRPLYDSWDERLAADLRARFLLDQDQLIKSLSRGQKMKAALLCALAPRPQLLLMDEPFTGLDVAAKDDLIRGLLGAAEGREWTAVIATHDIAEVESITDWVGFLDHGRLAVSKPVDDLREEYRERLGTPTLRDIFIALEATGRPSPLQEASP